MFPRLVMRTLFGLLVFYLAVSVFGHPGGGIVALSEDSALVADPTENFIWLVKKGSEPKRLVSKFHGHWMTRGRDGDLYTVCEPYPQRATDRPC